MVIRVLSRRSMMAGLAVGLGGCGAVVRTGRDAFEGVADSSLFHVGRHGDLTEQEKAWAKTAWAYFEQNTDFGTGLASTVRAFPVTSVWTMGDQMIAIVAAQRLGVIDEAELDRRVSQLLGSIGTAPLSLGRLPSRRYDTRTGKPALYDGSPGDLGWSAPDLGRLLMALAVLNSAWPRFATFSQRLVDRLDLCGAIGSDGQLRSADRDGATARPVSETVRGYDAYAAQGFFLWGMEPRVPVEPSTPYTMYAEGVPFPQVEQKDQARLGPVLTAPVVMTGLELGWSNAAAAGPDGAATRQAWSKLAGRVYEAQERRYTREGRLAARDDNVRSSEPYFVVDTIFARGYAFNTYDDKGVYRPDLALVSTRAAFGLWALWRTHYTDVLMETVAEVREPGSGWYEGRIEQTGAYSTAMSASTNAAVLECLAYKTGGVLIDWGATSPAPAGACSSSA